MTKLVTCQQADGGGLVPSIQQLSANCDNLLALITEDQFNITVTDTNVNPSNFNGSEIGTLVTLGAGPFTVTEEPYDSVAEEVAGLEDIQTEITGPSPSFSGDCNQTGIGSFSATGEIGAGGQETCNIVNNFNMTRTPPLTATVIVEKVMSGGPSSPEDSTICVSTTDPSTGIITPATPNCAPGSDPGFTYTVIPGTINIEETVVPASYVFELLGCSPDGTATAGETETCNVVNVFTGQSCYTSWCNLYMYRY